MTVSGPAFAVLAIIGLLALAGAVWAALGGGRS
jgi:hypothetical protein